MEIREEHRQRGHRVRLEWGAEGAALLAAECAVVVVVDVLSFGTSVDVAVGPLPDALVEDSVRVSGRGSAAVRVVGVDVVWRDLVDVPDERVRAAE
ncbi:MAG: hypothetical protein AVDCRST_MAG66-2408, partial [uncultured Pseudonocardia sp.]